MRVVLCSCPREKARDLAQKTVEAKLVACAQVIPTMESFYWWEGKMCQEQEALLLLKTDASVVESLTAFLKKHHSYSVPEIISLTVLPDEGNPDYLSWIQNEVQGT